MILHLSKKPQRLLFKYFLVDKLSPILIPMMGILVTMMN